MNMLWQKLMKQYKHHKSRLAYRTEPECGLAHFPWPCYELKLVHKSRAGPSAAEAGSLRPRVGIIVVRV